MKKEIIIRKGNGNKIIIVLPYNIDYIKRIKTIPFSKWHKEKKYWTVPLSAENVNNLGIFYKDEPVNWGKHISYLRIPHIVKAIEDIKKELKIRKYSKKTFKQYSFYNRELLLFLNKKQEDVNEKDIKNYLYYLAERKEMSTSALNIAISAFNFYYNKVLNKKFTCDIKRPKKDKLLPVVFNKEEIIQLLQSTRNLKHRAIIMMIYSGGLRVSDAVKLRFSDIDDERKLIFIKGGKGRKDRYTLLSEKALKTLKEYCRKYRPDEWLFPGQKKGTHISVRSIEHIVKDACEKIHCKKKAKVHTLRHSFATHLHESGVDIKYIQELLGHKNSKTTEIYTHVSRRELGKITSPLDNIDFNESKD